MKKLLAYHVQTHRLTVNIRGKWLYHRLILPIQRWPLRQLLGDYQAVGYSYEGDPVSIWPLTLTFRPSLTSRLKSHLRMRWGHLTGWGPGGKKAMAKALWSEQQRRVGCELRIRQLEENLAAQRILLEKPAKDWFFEEHYEDLYGKKKPEAG